MHPMVARAFIYKLLSDKQKESLKGFERRLEKGRYLQGFEICQMFRLKPDPVPEEETDRMQNLWMSYERETIWKGEQFEQEHSEVVPLSRLEQIWNWQEWASRYF